MKTQLPATIAPEDMTLASGPTGWTLAPTATQIDDASQASSDSNTGTVVIAAIVVAVAALGAGLWLRKRRA